MDHYPEVKVNERETPTSILSSRHDSASSVGKRSSASHGSRNMRITKSSSPQSYSYHSFPSPSAHSSEHSTSRSNSSSSNQSNFQRIEAEYSRYTHAPPSYSEKQYEGKTEDEKTNMRMTDYAKELSRMMGRQLIRGLRISEREKVRKEEK